MAVFINKQLERFNLLSSEIDGVYHDAALKMGLSDSAMMVLYTVCSYGDSCFLSDIVHMSGVSKQTINSSLRNLEADGIVYLEAWGARKKKVYLTERGRKLAEATVHRLIAIENGIFDSWSEEEKKLYLDLTQRYLTVLEEKVREL